LIKLTAAVALIIASYQHTEDEFNKRRRLANVKLINLTGSPSIPR